jgi:hypothetical protein
MKVSGQLHTPAVLLLRKLILVLIKKEIGWDPETILAFEEEKKNLFLPESYVVYTISHRYTDRAIPGKEKGEIVIR